VSNKHPIPYGNVAPRPHDIVESRLHTQMYPPSIYQAPPFSAYESDDSEERTLAEYLTVLRKHAKFLVYSTLVTLTLAVGYILVSTKTYSATATLQINTYLPVLAGAAREDVLRQQTSEENYISNQVAALRGLPLADRVLSKQNISDKFKKLYPADDEAPAIPGADSSYKHSSSELAKYLKLLRVSPVSETSLVRISSTAVNPKFAAELANTHAKEFIEMTKGYQLSDDIQNADFLKNQSAELEEKLRKSEEALSVYAEKHQIISFENGDSVEVERLNAAHRSIEAATTKRIEVQSQYKEAEKSLKLGSSIVDDPAINNVRQQLAQAQSEYAELGQRFNAGYPRMMEIARRVSSLKEQLESQRQSGLRALKAQLDAAVQAEKKLQSQLLKQETEAFRIANAQVDYSRMKRERDSLKELHQNIKTQLQQTQLSVGNANKGNIHLAEPAVEPDSSSSPKKGVALLLALFCGPVIGAAIAFLYDNFDQTLKGPEELEKALHTPGLGIIPNYTFDAPGFEGNEQNLPALATLNLVSLREPFSLASEGFRTIRAGIRLSSADRPLEVIVVTSNDQGEGKSTLVANLGVVFAQDDARTILIDADLRRATLHNCFGINYDEAGLTEILTGQIPLEECIQKTAVNRLDVIPAGGAVPNPAELVGSKKMRDLIEKLKEQYDYIIIDTPPVAPVADSLVLSPLADGVIVVVRSKKTIKKEAKKTLFKLRESGARILGVVLNGVEPSATLIRNDYLIKSKPRTRPGNPNWEQPGEKAA
jgi:polysaccharide biosynthesis transport protein